MLGIFHGAMKPWRKQIDTRRVWPAKCGKNKIQKLTEIETETIEQLTNSIRSKRDMSIDWFCSGPALLSITQLRAGEALEFAFSPKINPTLLTNGTRATTAKIKQKNSW